MRYPERIEQLMFRLLFDNRNVYLPTNAELEKAYTAAECIVDYAEKRCRQRWKREQEERLNQANSAPAKCEGVAIARACSIR